MKGQHCRKSMLIVLSKWIYCISFTLLLMIVVIDIQILAYKFWLCVFTSPVICGTFFQKLKLSTTCLPYKFVTCRNLINTLAEISQTGKPRHIPYRDSRLTFLLQESLGGNAKLAMVCAISPSQR